MSPHKMLWSFSVYVLKCKTGSIFLIHQLVIRGVTLSSNKELNTLCMGLFLKIGIVKGGDVLYFGKYATCQLYNIMYLFCKWQCRQLLRCCRYYGLHVVDSYHHIEQCILHRLCASCMVCCTSALNGNVDSC